MKPETIRKRLLEAAIQFGVNENALREERRNERKNRCEFREGADQETGYQGWHSCILNQAIDDRSLWCDNCKAAMALRETRGTPRRNRQLAKERIVRLTRALVNTGEAQHG